MVAFGIRWGGMKWSDRNFFKATCKIATEVHIILLDIKLTKFVYEYFFRQTMRFIMIGIDQVMLCFLQTVLLVLTY